MKKTEAEIFGGHGESTGEKEEKARGKNIMVAGGVVYHRWISSRRVGT